jgi:hypothetical protein
VRSSSADEPLRQGTLKTVLQECTGLEALFTEGINWKKKGKQFMVRQSLQFIQHSVNLSVFATEHCLLLLYDRHWKHLICRLITDAYIYCCTRFQLTKYPLNWLQLSDESSSKAKTLRVLSLSNFVMEISDLTMLLKVRLSCLLYYVVLTSQIVMLAYHNMFQLAVHVTSALLI